MYIRWWDVWQSPPPSSPRRVVLLFSLSFPFISFITECDGGARTDVPSQHQYTMLWRKITTRYLRSFIIIIICFPPPPPTCYLLFAIEWAHRTFMARTLHVPRARPYTFDEKFTFIQIRECELVVLFSLVHVPVLWFLFTRTHPNGKLFACIEGIHIRQHIGSRDDGGSSSRNHFCMC